MIDVDLVMLRPHQIHIHADAAVSDRVPIACLAMIWAVLRGCGSAADRRTPVAARMCQRPCVWYQPRLCP